MKIKLAKTGVIKRYFQSKASFYDLLEALVKNNNVEFLQRLLNKYYKDLEFQEVSNNERLTVDELVDLKGLARDKFRKGLGQRVALAKLEQVLIEVVIQDYLRDELYHEESLFMTILRNGDFHTEGCYEDDLNWEVGRDIWVYPKLSKKEFRKMYFSEKARDGWDTFDELFKMDSVLTFGTERNAYTSTNLILFSLSYAFAMYTLFDTMELNGVIDASTYVELVLESRITEEIMYDNILSSQANMFWNEVKEIVPIIFFGMYREDSASIVASKFEKYDSIYSNFNSLKFKKYYNEFLGFKD